MRFKRIDLLVLILLAAPFFYLYMTYSALPERMPIHWGLDGKPNNWVEKENAWETLLFISLIGAGIYFLLRFISKIDPKNKIQFSQKIFDRLALVIVVFVTMLNGMILYGAKTDTSNFSRINLVLVSLFLAFIGNLMHNLKPNYFFGIRTPWTLEDESNWKATHRLASKIWFAGGILAAILVVILPTRLQFVFFISLVIILAIIPVVYSFILFKKSKKESI